MSDIQLYLFEADRNKPEAQAIAERSAQKLEAKEVKLIDLITSLEEYINNKDDGAVRAKSVAYLAEVLNAMPPRVLTGQERRLLCDFILGRIEGDVEGIGSSARALLALEERGKWDAATSQKVMRTLVDHVNPLKQFKLQGERYAILQLVDLLLAKYRGAIRELSEEDAEFLPSFISFFDAEKDPRNLMIVFSVLQVPMTEWDIQAHAQDLFDSVFNYFPITFKPPPDDPYGITAQHLKDRLRDCIASTSDFAPYAFPALLDKLDSTSMNTKRDVLHTLQACIVSYEPKTINLYSVTLWDALKFEILAAQEEDLAIEALKALGLIANSFSTGTEGPLNAYLRPIIKECNEHLEDAPTKQSQSAGRILHAIASAAPVVADRIIKGVFPTLFELFKSSESISKRRGLIEVMNQIVKAFVDMEVLGDKIMIESLQTFSGEALEALLRALLNGPKPEVSFRLESLNGLVQLTNIRNLLSEADVDRVVDAVTGVVLHEHIQGHGDIRSHAIDGLTRMAHSVPQAIQNRSIAAFMVELPDVPSEGTSYTPTLEALAKLSSEKEVFDTIVLRLKNRLNAARQQSAPRDYQRALLMAMLYAFTYGSPKRDEAGVVRSSYFTDYAEPLLVQVQNTPAQNWEAAELEMVGRICNVLLRPQQPHFQSAVYNTSMQWLSPSAKGAADLQTTVLQLAPLSLHYYAALRPEVVEAADILTLLQAQASTILSAPKLDATHGLLLRHITLLVNKFANPKSLPATLASTSLDVTTLLSTPTPTPAQTALSFAVTKALITLNKPAPLISTYLSALFSLLPSTTAPTARLFATLLAPDEILTKENHCAISPLHKQKTCSTVVPALVGAITTPPSETPSQEAKTNHLLALSGVLQNLPFSILEPILHTLTPPLLLTLDLPSTAPNIPIKTSTLSLFEATLLHSPETLVSHLSSLVNRLLLCTSGHSAEVRMRALQCLALVPKMVARERVVGYRRGIVKKLGNVLDDGRRGVRAEGVKCRTAWLGLEEEEEEE